MARIRYLKPEFFSDEDLCSLSFQARILFAGLWCYADKAGRLEDRPKYLKAMLFPYDSVDIEKLINSLTSPKPFINRYEIEGKRYVEIINWEKHQRPHHTEKDSVFPPAPPLKRMEKGMGMEKQLEASTELRNGEVTVKEPLNGTFESFWKAYPKKIGKKDAEKSWTKAKDKPPIESILKAIENQKKSEQWNKDSGQFIPNPATWINQGRWDDEPKIKTGHKTLKQIVQEECP
jgi:hypothetical protein